MDVSDSRKRRTAILNTLTIPAASPTGQRLIELALDDDIDLSSLAQAIQSEPGITARIIGLANSAFFSAPCVIHTVEEATVKVLGLQMVRSLVMGMISGSTFDTSKCEKFSITHYWCRALAVAQAAAMFAKQVKGVDASAVYLAGLLHSMGQLLQVHHFPQDMSDVIQSTEDMTLSESLAYERNALGFDSSEAGSWVAKRWKLPDETIQTLAHYHQVNYLGDHWKIVRIVGFVARFFRGCPKEEVIGLAGLLDYDPDAAMALLESFSSIEDSVGVLAEHMVSHE